MASCLTSVFWLVNFNFTFHCRYRNHDDPHGYDSCPMEGFDDRRVRRILDVPKDGNVIMVLAAGRRADNGIYNRQYRFDPADFIHQL